MAFKILFGRLSDFPVSGAMLFQFSCVFSTRGTGVATCCMVGVNVCVLAGASVRVGAGVRVLVGVGVKVSVGVEVEVGVDSGIPFRNHPIRSITKSESLYRAASLRAL